jgi:polysaccharide export outer membrane protein
LFRRVNDQWFETKVLDVKRMVKDKNLAEDIELQPGDLIFVPRNRISKIERFVPSPGLGMALAP